MTALRSAPTPYTPSSLPILPDGEQSYFRDQLDRVAAAIQTTQRMTPQAANSPPKVLLDGMQRLSRRPWFPVAGQTTDQWVYYDGAANVWRLLSAAPTSI